MFPRRAKTDRGLSVYKSNLYRIRAAQPLPDQHLICGAAQVSTDSYRLVCLAEYSDGYLVSNNIAARYNVWHLTHFYKHAAALLAAAMASFPH